jgi:MFS family permease
MAHRPPARPALVLLLACLAQFMLLVDDTIVNVALPTLGADLEFTASGLSWVVNAYLLTFGGFLLIGGRLADRFGPRRTFSAALVGFALASALCGLAPSAEVLVGARGAQGVTAALLSPAALALLLATFPEGAERRRALSAWASLMGAGAATGLLAGGVLVQVADWRWIFLVNLPVALLALAAVPRVIPADAKRDVRAAPNVTGRRWGPSPSCCSCSPSWRPTAPAGRRRVRCWASPPPACWRWRSSPPNAARPRR